MNYQGIFGVYHPATRTGEIYDGRQEKKDPQAGLPCLVLPAPIVTLSGVTQAEFKTRLKAEIDKAEGGPADHDKDLARYLRKRLAKQLPIDEWQRPALLSLAERLERGEA
tara:strand:+ start:147 stop:476 length:330 start_codon:yes stop_codon:yes gene_type:complete